MTNALDLRNRAAIAARLEESQFDIVIIGGGITGAGIARDAAMRGLSVALLEGRDFASGTSSRSSKLVHGGLRYLAQGDLGVVREAARERKTLRRIAPHLAETNQMIVPAKTIAGLAKLRAGLWAYEKLGEVAKDERFRVLDRKQLAAEEPALNHVGLAGAILYPEYLTDDARLVLANLRAAVGDGAALLNYMRVVDVVHDSGKAIGIRAVGGLPGEDISIFVRGKTIVNAAGPWVDQIMQMSDPNGESRLQLTEGIHLVFDGARVPIKHTLIITASDKRSMFIIPRDGVVYAGTTDTFFPEPSYWPRFERGDVDYILSAINRALKIDPLTPDDIVTAWSGLRPLIAEPGKSPSEISRKDEVFEGATGVLSIAGGKLTAYRLMAERIVDRCEARLGRTPRRADTDQVLLPGGAISSCGSLVNNLLEHQLSQAAASRLARLYGDEAPKILADGGDVTAEVRHAVTYEGAQRLEDYWVRRSARAWFSAEPDAANLKAAAEAMAPLLGWSEQTMRSEIDTVTKQAQTDLETIRTTSNGAA